MYKIHNKQGSIQDLTTMQIFPPIKENREGRKYLAWMAEGNTPLSMDILDPWIAKRQERNLILQSTDWTVLPDAPLTAGEKSAWKVYRQKLRDVPQDFSKVDDIEWPGKSGLAKI